jgi:uroporphyrinogen-III synthase
MDTPRVLSTKKLLPHQKLFLLHADISVIEANFIDISYKNFPLTDIRQNLIFTSQNALVSFLANGNADQFKGYPVFCVGSKTKQVAEHYGFNVTASADYAEGLADLIITGHKNESFTFFSGSMRRDTLPGTLEKANIDFNEIEVYKTELTPHSIKSALSGILFFSPSAIESYLKENTITTETCFCIGTTTADALKGITGNIVIANKPTVENVIIQVRNYYKP